MSATIGTGKVSTTIRLSVSIDDFEQFREACVRCNTTMSATLRKFISFYIRKYSMPTTEKAS